MLIEGKLGLFSLEMSVVHQLLICFKKYLGQVDSGTIFRLRKASEFISGLWVDYCSGY